MFIKVQDLERLLQASLQHSPKATMDNISGQRLLFSERWTGGAAKQSWSVAHRRPEASGSDHLRCLRSLI